MNPDLQRLRRIRDRMRASGLDALLCLLPHNVLMLTGYAPVLGHSFAFFPLEGDPVLLVPDSEKELARSGWVADVRVFEINSLLQLVTLAVAAEPMLAQLARERDMLGCVIGYEHDYDLVPTSYTQMATPSASTVQLLQEAFGGAEWRPVDGDLEQLGAVLSGREVELVRLANLVAAQGMMAARSALRPGMRECDLAGIVSSAVLAAGHRLEPVRRVQPFVHVLSGPRTEHAYLPFGHTSGREILRGDQVLVQLEVYLDGFWAEIARTFFAGQASREQRKAYEVCLEAMDRALAVERAGVHAAGVDIAARSILTDRGYGIGFKHSLGHGVGFQAISRNRPPRLHPVSPDFLQPGMVHNLEPAVYLEQFGVRITDDVLVTESAPERLAPLETDLDWAICKGRRTISLPNRPAA